MNKVVLDSSAVLALINEEKGWETVEKVLGSAVISSVNAAEIISVLHMKAYKPAKSIPNLLSSLQIEIIPFTITESLIAGEIINVTKKYGLSLGDRACLATGILNQLLVLTSDKVWAKVKYNSLSVEVIR